MYSRSMFRSAMLVLIVVAFAALAFAARPSNLSDGWDRVQKTGKTFVRTPHGSLDQDYNEFRYVKTTDYGVTWSNRMVAGDMEHFAPNEDAWPDFDAVVTTTNELCYAVILHEATTPGAYALVGPSFTPVMVMAEGDNSFDTGYNIPGGRTGVGRCANGTLVMIIWGHDASGANTLWASKSTDNGATWNTPWVCANEAMLGIEEPYSHYFHISQRLHDDYGFVVYQTIGTDPDNPYPQHFLRFPLTGGLGTVVDLAAPCNHPYSYMIAACKPIAYDPAANALYLCYRNFDLDGMWVYYSADMGTSFGPASSILHPGQRYPSMALRNEGSSGTPFLIWNMTTTMPVGDPQCAWYSYDEFGYGGNAWTDPAEMTCVTRSDRGSIGECIYVNQGYFWNATQGVGLHNGATDPLSGELESTTYTTDGGITWTGFNTYVDFERDLLNVATMQNATLAGGQTGVAYAVFCGAPGISDLEVPSVTQLTLLSDPTTTGPYVVKAYYDDNIGIDVSNPPSSGPWVNWHLPGQGDTYVNQDSTQLVAPERNAGWYFFTIPGGWTNGDSLSFYCDGYDVNGNYGNSDTQIIIVGSHWLDVGEHAVATADEFRIIGNYPNPFNPTTSIEFSVPENMRVTLKIYNTLGQEVASLFNRQIVAQGVHRIPFDGSNLASGIYVCTLQGGSRFATQKMVLLK